SKKTQAETLKLQRIQKQLQALDDLVSTDIGILRTRIEQACIEFSHAKKRYDRAESEFVSAKLDLHKKSQIKDHLTEHLCTIIQENELRKAKRLEELMQQLDVEADEERLELEIEVDRMLQVQEAEAKKLLLSSTAEGEEKPSEVQETTCTAEKEQSSTEMQEISTTEKGDHKSTEVQETCQSPSGEGLSKTSEELTQSAHELETVGQ
ncbi:RAB6-interacting golgin, partial [Hyperolius riggenbachi]|uniref:RAB6-interacting golgin n=1 Tax=Hyperolius riggenbachi TaxID=752182 RepID=UPI0035A2EB5D